MFRLVKQSNIFKHAVRREFGKLSHVDSNNRPTMVNISGKNVTKRQATAESSIVFPPDLAKLIVDNEMNVAKGPVFATAIIAGTQAVKKTSDLIPFCHPLPIDGCKFAIKYDSTNTTVTIRCTVDVEHKTGVEMEALTGASVAALTVYDMCKAVSHEMVITNTRLMTKTGGKSGNVLLHL